MKKGLLRKVLAGTGITFGLLVVVLAVHIYLVTRPKPMNADMRIMARVDFRQELNKDDAAKITAFLYHQKGIDHVLCNPAGKLVVFTYYPAKTSAEQIIGNLNLGLPYSGTRFLPGKDQLASGCPVAATSFTYKAYHFFNHLF